MSLEYILLPERDGELILAIRAECPQDLALLAELHDYLLKYRPRAARLRRWAGLCLEDSTILIDPDRPDLLETYLHELAHATVGPHRGHDHVFAEMALALYKRFRLDRGIAGKRYDFHEAALHEVTPAKQAVRESRSREAAAQPIPVAALAEIGQRADRLDAAVASGQEWLSVLLPLLYIGLPALAGIGWIVYSPSLPLWLLDWWRPIFSAVILASCAWLLIKP